MRRRFNHSERQALYLVSGGRCVACDKPLPTGWHADHRQPFSRGGETSIWNGQALCPDCNHRKGDRMEGVSSWPAEQPLHEWQVAARAAWGSHNLADFLLVATPGSGKTRAALRIASDELQAGRVERIVVVVPTDHLRTQWADAAAEVGLQINPKWDNAGPDGSGFCGIVVTYHQVARAPDVHALNCRRRTLVIFDEHHHTGDTLTWGDAIRIAYGPAVRRLLLSGTPFRSDNLAIPFVRYEDGKSQADFAYAYGTALDQNVVRSIHFPNYEGFFSWQYRDQLMRATFQDAVPDEQSRRRLRTALDEDGEWLPSIIREADQRLTEIRTTGGHLNAGGLIICIDQWRAKRVAALVQRITGEAPTVAISDDADATDKITSFAKGNRRWLVAVRMVSEGVDVPRLRVGIYATNVITELYFRQVVGRFVRVTPGIPVAEQSAWLYIPADSELVEYARRIAEERDHQLQEAIQKTQRLLEAMATDDGRVTGEFTVLFAEDPELVGIVIGGEHLAPADLEGARVIRLQAGFTGLTDAQVALLFRLRDRLSTSEPATAEQQKPESDAGETRGRATGPLWRVRDRLRSERARLVNRLAGQIGVPHDQINRWLAERTGAYVKESSVEQLNKQIELLIEQLNRTTDGQRDFGG
jgi:superfamily II DNA or RNA helicase